MLIDFSPEWGYNQETCHHYYKSVCALSFFGFTSLVGSIKILLLTERHTTQHSIYLTHTLIYTSSPSPPHLAQCLTSTTRRVLNSDAMETVGMDTGAARCDSMAVRISATIVEHTAAVEEEEGVGEVIGEEGGVGNPKREGWWSEGGREGREVVELREWSH